MIAPMIASTTPSDRGTNVATSRGAGLPPGDDAFAALFQGAAPFEGSAPPTGEEHPSHSGGADHDAAFDSEPAADRDSGLIITPISCPLAFPALPLPVDPPASATTDAADVPHSPELIAPVAPPSPAEAPVVTAPIVAMPVDVRASTTPSDTAPKAPPRAGRVAPASAPTVGGAGAAPLPEVAAPAASPPSSPPSVAGTAEIGADSVTVDAVTTDALAAQVARQIRPAAAPDLAANVVPPVHPSDAAPAQPTPAAFDVLPASGERKRLMPEKELAGAGGRVPFEPSRPTLFDTLPVGADRSLATPSPTVTLAPPQPAAPLASGTMPASPNGEAAWAHRASLLAGALSRGDGAALHLATAAFGTVRVDLTPVGADSRVGWTLSGSDDDAVGRLHSFVPAAAEAIQRHFATTVDLRVERHEPASSTGSGTMQHRDPSDTGQQSAGRREPAAQEIALRTVNRNDPGRSPPLTARTAPHERLA